MNLGNHHKSSEIESEAEFESILRRHLRAAGATACAGFDADTASAYLERALSPVATSAFEGHLGACSSCRRHVIELSRLFAPAVLQDDPVGNRETVPSGSPAASSGLIEWLRTLGQSFGNWQIGWQWAGAGALATALIVAFVAHQFRPGGAQITPTVANVDLQPRTSAETQVAAIPAPIATSVPEVALSATPAPRVERPTERPRPAGAEPPTRQDLARGEAALPAEPLRPQSSMPQLPEVADVIATDRLPALTPGPAPVSRTSEISPIVVSERGRSARSASGPFGRSGAIGPFGINPPIESFFPGNTTAAGRKQPSAEETRVIQGKTFVRRNGSWVDTQYLNSFLSGRIVKLTIGSEEYQRVLAETPELEVFFSLQPVTVVWRNIAYIVRGPK